MTPIHILYVALGAFAAVFLGLFAVSSVRERRPRAAVVSTSLAAAVVVVWLAGWIWGRGIPLVPIGGVLLVLVPAALFALPIGRATPLGAGGVTGRVDQRTIMFAREEYHPGDGRYEAYYAAHPEHRRIDDRIRRLPELLAPGGRFYDAERSERVREGFRRLEGMIGDVDGPVARRPGGPEEDAGGNAAAAGADEADRRANTRWVREELHRLGAAEVGIAPLNPAFVYSHVGRGPEPWGAAIENRHRHAICFTLEMRYEKVEEAPRIGITEETVARYLEGAEISIALARAIRARAWPARAHVAGSNYQIMLPAVAHDAGLGEIGRLGYLISPRHGARFRLGAVTTDLPLVDDVPIVFGVQEFCALCRRCAEVCPSGSIPPGGRTLVRGIEKWPLQVETCLHYWRLVGTDCGLCMKVCPFSHPRGLVHDVVRWGIARSTVARRMALWGERVFYGKVEVS